jgi:hypothetical protein
MIFLSAQPDDFYFTWQLELQIHNFNSLGDVTSTKIVIIENSSFSPILLL